MRGEMATMNARSVRRTWPIVYGQRTRTAPEPGVGLAWALFLFLGVPFGLMTVLTILARGGIYVDLFRPLWQPWPPDLLKPLLGVAVFAATLAYLTYRRGHRAGYRAGSFAALVSARKTAEGASRGTDPASAVSTVTPQSPPVPPPPPEDGWTDL